MIHTDHVASELSIQNLLFLTEVLQYRYILSNNLINIANEQNKDNKVCVIYQTTVYIY